MLNLILGAISIAILYLVTWWAFGAEGWATASSEAAQIRKEKPKAIIRFISMLMIIAISVITLNAPWYMSVGVIGGYNVVFIAFISWFTKRCGYNSPMN